jgi:hypothetical protein
MKKHTITASLAAGALAYLWSATARAELFVDVGVNVTRVDAVIANEPANLQNTEGGLHVGVGVRRALRSGNEIGARLELDSVDSDMLLAVRAFDYRFNRSDRFAIGAFIGAARLDLATPAYGYYLGGGVHFRKVVADWDLSAELRYGDDVARDNVLASDPQGGSPDNFYDLSGIALYLSRRF